VSFVLVGAALIVLGFVALNSLWVAGLATALAIGMLLLASGVAEFVGAILTRSWTGFFLHLLSSVLAIVVGSLILQAPVDALLTLTLLLACFLMVVGIFKIAVAVSYRFAAWGWTVLSGAIDMILGFLIVLEWPASALWVVGLFLGISLVFHGVNWIGLGLAFRAPPPSAAE
jgi:uncharacterized membrane protein HdeD (DUF308 family)